MPPRIVALLLSSSFVIACGDDGAPVDASTTGTPTSTSSADSSSTGASTTAEGSSSEGSSSSSGADTTTDPSGGQGAMCDLFDQDCGAGLKCMYGCDGPTCTPRCRPVRAGAVGPGEACVAEALDAEFPDDCDEQTLCWTGEAEAGEGICEPFCTGSAASPSCEDPDRVCAQQQVCLDRCDPLLQDCGDGRGCFDVDVGAFVCWNVQEVPIADGDPCGGNTLCNPGSTCAFADTLVGCGGSRCCTPLCDTDDGDATCTALDPDLACVEYGAMVPGAATLGVCALPQ